MGKTFILETQKHYKCKYWNWIQRQCGFLRWNIPCGMNLCVSVISKWNFPSRVFQFIYWNKSNRRAKYFACSLPKQMHVHRSWSSRWFSIALLIPFRLFVALLFVYVFRCLLSMALQHTNNAAINRNSANQIRGDIEWQIT